MVITIGLNLIFIPLFGIEGAALATLISIALYSLAKLFFVVFKLNLFPFTSKTLVSLATITLSFVVFYFWDFAFHPLLNIVLKSILITLFYWGINYKLNVSSDLNQIITSLWNRVANRSFK